MLPIYRWFHKRTGLGDPSALEAALAHLWADLGGVLSKGLEHQRDAAEALAPSEADEDAWVTESALAQNAAAAVAYAIKCRLTGNAQYAVWAARQIYEALDYWITLRNDVDWSGGDAEKRARAEEEIVADDLIQAELYRQKRDLEILRRPVDGEVSAIALRMRGAARSEGATAFGNLM
jgi:hypothetical protein